MKLRFLALLTSGLALVAGSAPAQSSLKDAYKNQFLIGTALNTMQASDTDPQRTKLIVEQFNSITPENAMKWGSIHPRQGAYQFDAADKFVAFGTKYRMFVVGHNLVWHSQTPDWVFKNEQGGPASREMLLARMREHIQTVVGRYRGRIKGWDVVNEALAEDGSLRNSPWRRIIGDDYIAKAFTYAHEADPEAELYYNDYGIETGRKRDGAIDLLKKLRAAGVPVTGVGLQDHVNLEWPEAQALDQTITLFGRMGLKVMITEIDVDVLPSRSASVSADVSRKEAGDSTLDPYVAGLPDEKQQALARRYAELFAVYLRHPKVVTRVTFWGVTDGDSWLNNFPIRGRTAYPLLFDRAGHPKPAYNAVIGASRSATASGAGSH